MVGHGWLNMTAKQNKLIDLLLSPLYIYIYIYVYVIYIIFMYMYINKYLMRTLASTQILYKRTRKCAVPLVNQVRAVQAHFFL